MLQTYRWRIIAAMALTFIVVEGCGGGGSPAPAAPLQRIASPPAGKVYHGIFPGCADNNGEEDKPSKASLQAYTNAVGKSAAWVYFSSEWWKSRAFPRSTCDWIRQEGAVPYIRLMLRDINEPDHPNTVFTFTKILAGDFDADLRAWARGAKTYGSPLIVEYGTEVNGSWFQWNGKWNGAGQLDGFGDPTVADGPERFRAVYRHIIDVMREAGARNIVWVFHIAVSDDPEDAAWNRFELYYPGDTYIDWVGVSAYGPQTPMDEWWAPFREQFDPCYARITAMTTKPVILSEFGCTAGHPAVTPQAWADAALKDLLGNRWPRLIGFSWWNEHFANDDDPAHDTNFRIQELPALASTFKDNLKAATLQTTPVKVNVGE